LNFISVAPLDCGAVRFRTARTLPPIPARFTQRLFPLGLTGKCRAFRGASRR
jgi:hypothetical protein